MENPDQIFQHQVRVERKIFVIRPVSRIATIYLLLLISLETGVRRIILPDTTQGIVGRLIVFHHPYIGLLCLVEYRFETQRHGTAIGVMVEYIFAPGIFLKLAGGTSSSRHIPSRTAFQLAHHFRFYGLRSGKLFQLVVILFDDSEDAVCFGTLME